jgi:hypothetical protein
MNARAEACRVSDEYKRREQERVEADRLRKIAYENAMATALPVEWKNPAAWDETLAAQTSDYGRRTMEYAKEWGQFMQAEVAKGRTIAECYDETSRIADHDGITGYMHGCARSMLQQWWIYGDELAACPR